jgi:hypothetical protein
MCMLGFLSLLSVLSAPPRSCAPAKQQSRGMEQYALMLFLAALVVISGVTLLMPLVH